MVRWTIFGLYSRVIASCSTLHQGCRNVHIGLALGALPLLPGARRVCAASAQSPHHGLMNTARAVGAAWGSGCSCSVCTACRCGPAARARHWAPSNTFALHVCAAAVAPATAPFPAAATATAFAAPTNGRLLPLARRRAHPVSGAAAGRALGLRDQCNLGMSAVERSQRS